MKKYYYKTNMVWYHRLWLGVLCILCSMVVSVGNGLMVYGQSLDDRLDQELFIEGLSEYGFDDVLSYLQESYNDGITDPALEYLINIGRARLAVLHWTSTGETLNDPDLSKSDAIEKLQDVRRELIKTFPDDYRCAKWQGDLAFDLLFIAGTESGLDLTVEFGAASDSERLLLSGYVKEAADITDLALDRVEDWIIELEDSQDFSSNIDIQQKRRNLINIEKNQRLPFLWGVAQYLAIVTRSEHELQDEVVLSEVVSTLSSLVLELDEPWLSRAKVTILLARVHLNEFEETDLIEQLQKLADDNTLDQATRFRAVAGVILASGKMNDALAALNSIDEYMGKPWINNDPYWLLLLTDQQYKWRLQAAKAGGLVLEDNDKSVVVDDKGLPAINWACSAYESYITNEDLLLSEAQRSDIVFNRLVRIMPEGLPSEQMPPLMILAEAQKAIADAGTESDLETRKQAIQLLENLLPQDDLSEALKARLLYMLSTVYVEDGRYLEAISLLLQLANDYSLDHKAPVAAGQALRLALYVYYENPGNEPNNRNTTPDDKVRESLLEQAFATLLERYPSHVDFDWAALQRGDYEIQNGRFDEAVQAYSLILAGSELYIQAKYNIVSARYMKVKAGSSSEEQAVNLSGVIDQADSVLDIYHRLQTGENYRDNSIPLSNLSHYISLVELIKAEVYLLMNEPGQALGVIKTVLGIDGIRDDDDLIIQCTDLHIRVLDALGRYGEIEKALENLVKQFPDKASGLLDTLIADIYQRVKAIENNTEIDKEISEAQQQLLPLVETRLKINANIDVDNAIAGFYIADAFRLTGDYNQAKHYFDKIADGENNLSVVTAFGRAECLYHQKEYSQAIGLYQQLISKRPNQDLIYWQAELRQLQILDLVQRNTDRIYSRIQRLKKYDSQLGGVRFLSAFSVLERKYAP